MPMGSQLSTLRSLVENQIDVGTTDTNTDPTSTLLNDYINKAIRNITRELRPHELFTASAITANISSGANTVSLPATILIPQVVYYKTSTGNWRELLQRDVKSLIQLEGADNWLDSSNTGDPQFYSIAGGSIVFNKYFDRTATGAISIIGVKAPTSLSDDTDTTELTTDYDLLIAYKAAVYYYQKDDDIENQAKFNALYITEKNELKTSLETYDARQIGLDPVYFPGHQLDAGSPSFLFGV